MKNNRFLSYSLVREEMNKICISWIGLIQRKRNSNKFLWIAIVMHMLTWRNEVIIYILIIFINE